jgi:hypothetical protein
MRKRILYSLVVFLGGVLIGNLRVATAVEVAKPCEVNASGDACIFDLKATADGLLQAEVSPRPDTAAKSAPPRSRPQAGEAAQPALAAAARPKTTRVASARQPPSQLPCGAGRIDLGQQLLTIAEGLQGIPYTQNPPSALQDCSGMFHQVVQKFHASCPGYALPSHLHSRRPVRASKITNYYYRQPRSTPKYPYGNGAEQWIGMARFVQDAPK